MSAAAKYVRTNEIIQYDGTNGAAVAAFMGRQIVSDTGTQLKVQPIGQGWGPTEAEFTFGVGDWYSNRTGFAYGPDISVDYVLATTMTNPPPTADVVGTMDGVSVSVPVLLLGGSVDRVVTWNRAFPDANYKLSYLQDANTIGRITIAVKNNPTTGLPIKSASGLTLVISAGLAVTVAGVLHVLGTT